MADTPRARRWPTVAAVWLAACALSALLMAVIGGASDLPLAMAVALTIVVLAVMSAPLAIGCILGGASVPRLIALVTGIALQIAMIPCPLLGFPASVLAGYIGGVMLACGWRR